DPKLTANRYTHLGLDVEAGAIASLPMAPTVDRTTRPGKTAEDLVAVPVAGTPVAECPGLAPDDKDEGAEGTDGPNQSALLEGSLGGECHPLAWDDQVHPRGFEPL